MSKSPKPNNAGVTGIKPIVLSLMGGVIFICVIDLFIQSGNIEETLISKIIKSELTKIPNPTQNKNENNQEQTKNAREEFERKNPEQNRNNNSNIVKVLNRVSCTQYSECPAHIAESVWKSCLDKGYTTSTPDREVISARDLKELTQGEGGFAYEGYCIGSEYITK